MQKEKIPILVMSPINTKVLLEEDEKARAENAQIPFRFGYAIKVDIDIKTTGLKKELPNGDKL